jgi:hypothetical protein
MLLTHFLNDFEIASVAPIITCITLAFTFHMRSISIVRSLYFKILSAFIIIIIIITTTTTTAIELSLCGSSPYTSTDKINKNKYT